MFQPSLSALENVVQPQMMGRMPALSLNHELVMSEWEQMGGTIFSGSDEDPPQQFTLDLSSVEATMHPSVSRGDFCPPPYLAFPTMFPGLPDMGMPMHTSYGGYDMFNPQEVKFPDFGFPWHKPYMYGNILPKTDMRRPQAQNQLVPNIKQEPGRELPTRNGSSSTSSNQSSDIAVVPDVGSPGSSSPVSHTAANNMLSSSVAAAAVAAAAQSMLPAVAPMLNSANSLRVPAEGEQRTRKQCLERYREKKARRMYAKRIRYQLRKINADKRPRIKGRFVKKEELEEYLKVATDKLPNDEDDGEMVEDDDDVDEGSSEQDD